MKMTSELTNRETNPYKLISNGHECVVVNERLVYDYLFRKVAVYIWVADINKLAVIVKRHLKLRNNNTKWTT